MAGGSLWQAILVSCLEMQSYEKINSKGLKLYEGRWPTKLHFYNVNCKDQNEAHSKHSS